MFLAPLFLLGLIAIGVPIWLHRVARANPVHHTFPSLMLLEASETQRTAQRTLRYWLLLLLRILLLAALAFAFAGPLWEKEQRGGLASDAKLHAILLDASVSMQHNDQWTRALAAAEAVLKSVRSADQVMLVRAAGRRMDVVQEPISGRNTGSVRAALRSMQPSLERLDFGFAMSTADQWLRKPRPPVLLHVISDFQRSGAPLRFADLEPPSGAQLIMHEVFAGDRANVYIQSATLSEDDARAVQVRVSSTYTQSQDRAVILSIDGEERARKSVKLDPAVTAPVNDLVAGEGGISRRVPLAEDPAEEPSAQSSLVIFEGLEFSPGAHRVEVRLEPQDSLPHDDRYFAVIEHANPKALLLERGSDSDDAAYFASAIGALAAPRVEVTRQPAGSFDGGSFSDYSLIVVPDVFALSTSAADRIQRYVEAGGAVLTTLGSGASEAESPLLASWQIEKPRARLLPIGNIDTSHPILRDAPQWSGVRFFRQRPVQMDEADRVLIAHTDGTALLIERAMGAGRMLILTAPVDRAWNDLAIHPVFVQFISQAARYLIGDASATASTTVGTPVPTGLTAESGGQIFDPEGKRVLDLADMTAAERLLPTRLGFYEARHANGAKWLAVNIDRRESELTALDAEYLNRWRALTQRSKTTPTPAPEVAADTQTQSLGPALLWLAALLLIAELLVANRYLAVRRESAQ
jgi:hypothetical protein